MPITQIADVDVQTPPGERVLWRYMDFGKYVWTLARRKLWFSRADELGDPFEGSRLISGDARAQLERVREKMRKMVGQGSMTYMAGDPDQRRASIEHSLKEQTQMIWAANCWHGSQGESAALWRLYAPRGLAVAVRTTVAGLTQSLEADPTPMHLGVVTYHDYRNETEFDGNLIRSCFRKRLSFKHEEEVRAVVFPLPGLGGSLPWPKGVAVAADLARLIQRVFVDPAAPQFVVDAVRSATDAFGLDADLVEQSELGKEKPVFL